MLINYVFWTFIVIFICFSYIGMYIDHRYPISTRRTIIGFSFICNMIMIAFVRLNSIIPIMILCVFAKHCNSHDSKLLLISLFTFWFLNWIFNIFYLYNMAKIKYPKGNGKTIPRQFFNDLKVI
jgi:hypothetical protein